MTNALGLGVIGQGGGVKTHQVIAEIDALDLSAVMVINEAGMSKEILAARPNVENYFRATLPGQTDDNLHTKISPQDWVNYMNGYYLPQEITWVCNNEPTTEYDKLNDWSVEVMRILKGTGRKVVMLNFSVWNPPDGVWANNMKGALKAICESDGQFILGVHEYIFPELGDWQANYGKSLMRVEQAWDVCRSMGYARPDTVVTETGFEPTWQRISNEEEFANYMVVTHGIYAKLGIRTLMFIYGDWYSGGNYDVRPAMNALKSKTWPTLIPYDPNQDNTEPEEPEEPVIATHKLYILSANGSNVRSEPNASATKLGGKAQGTYTGIAHNVVTENGYAWVQWGDDSINGWIAMYSVNDPEDLFAKFELIDGDGTNPPLEDECKQELLETYLALQNEHEALRDFHATSAEYWAGKVQDIRNSLGVG